jgi:glycosyltransferase involved in cell wall biosynthesis
MKAAVAHLIPAPFTQQVARALEQQGSLAALFCTLVDQPEGYWQRAACGVASLAGIDLRRDLRRRAITEVPAERVRSYPRREVLRMAQVRLLNNPVLGDRVFHWGRDGFEAWVARQLDGLDLIYGYEYGALRIFREAERLGIRTVYDLPSPEHDFVERLLAPEFAQFPELVTPYRQHTLALQAERTKRRRQEWELADLVIANSSFTARSWQQAGWSPRRVVVVPYGAPPPITAAGEGPLSRPLRLLWAGTFSIRKGAHLLVEAVRTLAVSPTDLVLDVYGAQGLPPSLLAVAPENLHFHGSVPRAELLVHMQQAHALLFPTLCDGFGLVVNEAFSQGLPVITTTRAGAADLVRPGENGLLIEAGSAEAIAAVIDQALKDPDALNRFRPAALATAAQWQWSDYRRTILNSITQLNHGSLIINKYENELQDR